MKRLCFLMVLSLILCCLSSQCVGWRNATAEKSVPPQQKLEYPAFADNDIDMVRFYNNFSWVRDAYIGNNIIFEDHSAEILLKKYLDIC